MATNVYYSASPFDGGDIKVACNISISGGVGVATFSVAQTGNIGIGDRVISSNVDGYISEMTNSTTATIVSALGIVHGNVSSETLTSIAHEYLSLAAFEAGFTDENHVNDTDLTNADVAVYACCYYDHDDFTHDTSAVAIFFGVTDATRNLTIFTPTGGTESINDQRHDGRSFAVSGTGYKLVNSNSAGILRIAEDYVDVIGLEIESTVSNSVVSFTTTLSVSNSINISKCIMHNIDTSSSNYIMPATQGNLNLNVTNSIMYGGSRSINALGANSVNLLNCTMFSHSDTLIVVGEGELSTINSYAGKVSGSTEDFWTTGASPSGNNNASSDGTASTDYTSSVTSAAPADQFVSVTSGSEDFTIKDNSADIYNAGTNTGAPSDDIIGTSRPQSTTVDIGAFELIVGAPPAGRPLPQRVLSGCFSGPLGGPF